MKNYWTTFTVTVAAPAVFTCANHGLSIGDRIVLDTTGALPTGLTANTQDYYVIRRGYTPNTFQLATGDYADNDATGLTTTGTQSGTQTFLLLTRDRITLNQIYPR